MKKDNLQILNQILQRQAQSGKITLVEQHIGDSGAQVLSEFLRKNLQIELLDLKGNNIGPNGFLQIFEALKQNKMLKTLLIPWNNITGGNNLQALEQLFQLVNLNKCIVHIDLQNNGIKLSGAAIISNIIRTSPFLKSIDVRWNELTNQGIQLLIGAIHANGYIQSVECSGNGAQEETLRELNRVLQEIRLKSGVPQQNLYGSRILRQPQVYSQQQYFQTQQQQQQQQQYSYNPYINVKPQIQQHLEDERKSVIKHLEKLIERERGNGIQIKEQLEDEVQSMKMKLNSIKQKIDGFQQNIASQQNEKQTLLADKQRWDSQLNEMQEKKLLNSRNSNERVQQLQKQRQDIEKQHQNELINAQSEHFNQLRELDQQWGQKCDQLIENNRKIDDYNQELMRQIINIKDEIHNFNLDNQNKTSDLVERIRKTILNENKQKLSHIEMILNQIDSRRLELQRQGMDDLANEQKSLRQNNDDYEIMVREKLRLGIENQDEAIKNKQYELYIKSIEQDIEDKDNLCDLLQQELNKLKIKNESVNDEDRDQLNMIQIVHKQDLNKSEKEINQLRRRLEELMTLVQNSESENKRLYNDINRISELLQANASKSIFETLQKSQVI